MALRERIGDYWATLRRRLDHWNRSLAHQAIPNHRRARVGELSLKEKEDAAGSKRRESEASRGTPRGS